MISEKNRQVIERLIKETSLLKGDVAEVGVSIGDTAEILCKLKGNKKLHLFDTFSGHPIGYIGRYDMGQEPGRHAVDLVTVKKRFQKYKNVYFYKGIFPETSDPVKNRIFSFVNLDTDLYKSTLEGLEFFHSRMLKGGIIVVHDMPTIPGVAMAVIDFCDQTGKKAWVANNNNQAVIRYE